MERSFASASLKVLAIYWLYESALHLAQIVFTPFFDGGKHTGIYIMVEMLYEFIAILFSFAIGMACLFATPIFLDMMKIPRETSQDKLTLNRQHLISAGLSVLGAFFIGDALQGLAYFGSQALIEDRYKSVIEGVTHPSAYWSSLIRSSIEGAFGLWLVLQGSQALSVIKNLKGSTIDENEDNQSSP